MQKRRFIVLLHERWTRWKWWTSTSRDLVKTEGILIKAAAELFEARASEAINTTNQPTVFVGDLDLPFRKRLEFDASPRQVSGLVRGSPVHDCELELACQ